MDIVSPLLEAYKIYSEFKDDKKYKEFIFPYREEFKSIINNFYDCSHIEDSKMAFDTYIESLSKEIGWMRIFRYFYILDTLNIVGLRDTGSSKPIIFIKSRGVTFSKEDRDSLFKEIEQCIYDTYFIKL